MIENIIMGLTFFIALGVAVVKFYRSYFTDRDEF